MKALILQIIISPSKNLPTFLLSNSMVGSGDFQIYSLRFNPYPGPACFRLVPSCKDTNRHKMFLLLCPELFPFAQAAAKLLLSSGGYHGNWQPCWLFPTPPFFFVRVNGLCLEPNPSIPYSPFRYLSHTDLVTSTLDNPLCGHSL